MRSRVRARAPSSVGAARAGLGGGKYARRVGAIARADARSMDGDALDGWLETLALEDVPSSIADARAAYRRAMAVAHPDVGGTVERAIATRRAYEGVTRAMEMGARRTDRADAFAATTLAVEFDGAAHAFVDTTRCVGVRRCSCSCVARAPGSFEVDGEGLARATRRAPPASGDADADAEWLAAAQCPVNCVHFVTARQRDYLEGVLENARAGACSTADASELVAQLLARAEYNNGREAGFRASLARDAA